MFAIAFKVCVIYGGYEVGTPVAQVLLGRPLDLSMPVRFAADAGDNECVTADVFYGETRVKSGVRATVTGPADQRRVRIEFPWSTHEALPSLSGTIIQDHH